MITLHNRSLETISSTDPKGILGPLSRIINSDMAMNFSLDSGSCVNRSAIGEYFGLGCYSYIADAEIGRYCTIASRVSIGPFNHPLNWLSIHEFQYRDLTEAYGTTIVREAPRIACVKPITKVGSDVWIGDNVSVVRGCNIGHGAVIGMSSVVVGDIPPYAIAVGNPAKVKRYRFPEATIVKLLELEWWNLGLECLRGINFQNIDIALTQLYAIKAGQFSA